MDRYLQLMCKDVLVAEQKGGWVVYHPELVPHNLDFLSETIPDHCVRTSKSLFLSDEEITLNRYRTSQFIGWLSGRVLSIDRINAKKILNALSLSQNQSLEEKASISLSYRGVSLCDSWWVKFGNSDEKTWSDINLFSNSLNETIALIGLSGGSMTVQGLHGMVAEISVKGSYGKGWFREGKDRTLFMYKAEDRYGEAEREVCASQVIDCLNVYANLRYDLVHKFNPLTGVKSECSRCQLMSTPDKAVVHAAEFDSYLRRHGSNAVDYAFKKYPKEFSQMVVIDYLIGNSDRHGENWGFFRSMNSGEILGLHPLYDHNNAFDENLAKREDSISILISGSTMKKAAIKYFPFSELKIIKEPTLRMFPNRKAFEMFSLRCDQLGLKYNPKDLKR